MNATCFDERHCELGEGPLWYPQREQLFWFDILGKRLLTREHGEPREWQFEECVSAAGWIDREHLLIASETKLFKFNIETGETVGRICSLEADNPVTRSNDGRADPYGGFWIGTMGKNMQRGAGSIYRWYRGSLEKLVEGITVSNAICFSPDGKFAHYCDTWNKQIMRQSLDGEGWPIGQAEVFIDLVEEGLNPDGAVVDSEGCLWNAQWGACRVARYNSQGLFMNAYDLPAKQTSCPAFGGPDLGTLFITTAREGLEDATDADGQTFAVRTPFTGQAEHRVIV